MKNHQSVSGKLFDGNPAPAEFSLGDWRIIVISDGKLNLGRPADWFKGLPEAELTEVMRAHFLASDNVSISENVMVAESKGRRVMFDAGGGNQGALGSDVGRLLHNLCLAGIDPETIDDIVISHGHPDHMFGLVDAEGEPSFPNAQVHVSEVDLNYFSDVTNEADPKIGAFIFRLSNIFETYSDRISLLQDGKEVVPGVTAIAAPGHTFGHMVCALHSGDKTLINAADIAHHFAIFTEHPEASFSSDMDSELMARTRRRLFDMFATDRLPFIGYHFPFPGVGHVAKVGNGFRFVPVSLDSTGFID